MRVADLILDVLAAHGVHDVFGVPGDAINDITYALRKRDDMRVHRFVEPHAVAVNGEVLEADKIILNVGARAGQRPP